ncbi:MAG: hypothetical protein ABW065_08365 [Solirubrobacterales bacterium]
MSTGRKLVLVGFALVAIAFLAVTALFLYRPALVIGVHGDHLGESISSELGSHSPGGRCHKAASGRWRCAIFIEPDPGSGGGEVAYWAKSDDSGCWQARRPTAPRRVNLAGCIGIFDLF